MNVIYKGANSVSILSLCNDIPQGETRIYAFSPNANNISDYPSAMTSAGAIYRPFIRIEKYDYSVIEIVAVVGDWIPKKIIGFLNSGVIKWSSVFS